MISLVADPHGNLVVVSVVWVRLKPSSDAHRFEALECTYGSGDVTPLATEALELGDLRFTGKHYASRRDRSLVVIAETEAVRGNPSTAFLRDVAEVADLLPPTSAR